MDINDERPKLKVKLNRVKIKGLLDSGAGVSINFTRILGSKLASTRSLHSSCGYWNLISSKTECKMD